MHEIDIEEAVCRSTDLQSCGEVILDDLPDFQLTGFEIWEASKNKRLVTIQCGEINLNKTGNVIANSANHLKVSLTLKQVIALLLVLLFCLIVLFSVIKDFNTGKLTLEYALKTVGGFLAGAGAKAVFDMFK